MSSCNLLCRQEKAALLEFKTYALLSLDSKMAGSPSEVWRLITELQQKSKPAAEMEIRRLQVWHILQFVRISNGNYRSALCI